MRQYRQELRKNSKEILSDRELLGELYDVYYNNRDLKLLLDLLAQSSGVVPALRIMTLFDREFRNKSEPSNLKVVKVMNYYNDLSFIGQFKQSLLTPLVSCKLAPRRVQSMYRV